MKFKILALATASLAGGCVPAVGNAAKPVYGNWGYDPSAMDSSVKPGDDFWAYVNGTWDKTHPDRRRPRLGRSVRHSCPTVRAATSARSSSTSPATRTATTSASRSAIIYASFMDEARDRGRRHRAAEALSRRDRRGEDARRSCSALFVEAGLRQPGRPRHRPGFQGPDRYSAFAGQATLGMPSREYYLDDNAKMKAHRAAYRDYIITIRSWPACRGGEAAADRIIALETALSKAQWPAADRRDIDKIYNPMTRAQLIKLAPQFDWNATLAKARPRQRRRQVIVTEPTAVAGAGKILASTPLVDLEGMARLPLRLRPRERAAEGVRRRALRLLFEGAARRSAAARALEARRCRGQRRARRRRRRDLREDALSRRDPSGR